MSYSCTGRGTSQEPSSAKKAAGDPPDGGPQQTAAMRVKKGCNSSAVEVPVTTEEDLLASALISPEDVLGLQKITDSKLGRWATKEDKGAGDGHAWGLVRRPSSRTWQCAIRAPPPHPRLLIHVETRREVTEVKFRRLLCWGG